MSALSDPVHFSTLKWVAQSPAHYAYYALNRTVQTAPQRKGHALHSYLLGDRSKIYHYASRRVGKAYEEFKAAVPEDATILNTAEMDALDGMAESVERNSRAKELLLAPGAHREKTIQWRWLGRDCEGTPDVFCPDFLTELKSHKQERPDKFIRSARWYGYHAQLAWYRNALVQNGFGAPKSNWIVGVESTAPYPVTIFQVTERAIEQGERACRGWMEQLLVCEGSDEWPAYSVAPVPFDVEDGGFTLTIGGEQVDVGGGGGDDD